MRFKTPCTTGSGWCCLWDTKAFLHVPDEDTSMDTFLDDDELAELLAAGALVPVNDFSDGGYDIEIRVDEQLSDEEVATITDSSSPYLFRCGGTFCVSGIEFVGQEIDTKYVPASNVGSLQPNDYMAVVHRQENASPEFIVLLSCAPEDEIDYRLDTDTFNQQPSHTSGNLSFRILTCNDWRAIRPRVMEITGHDEMGVRVMLKSKDPLFLGNLDHDHEQIRQVFALLQALTAEFEGTIEWLVDGNPVDGEELARRILE